MKHALLPPTLTWSDTSEIAARYFIENVRNIEGAMVKYRSDVPLSRQTIYVEVDRNRRDEVFEMEGKMLDRFPEARVEVRVSTP